MGSLQRTDFNGGWYPSADSFNCPKNALLRMDNCVLDEVGAISLRHGSAKINTVALTATDVHSLFATSLNSGEVIMAGATNSVFTDGIEIQTGITGTGDISFGAHQGQILFARGTTKKKFDGGTVRNWGIAPMATAPVLSALAADSKVFASCASSESPILTVNEGALAFQPDKAGTSNAACELTPDATTARATATKTFGAATDFTLYDAGQTGSDDDLIEMYVYITEPQFIDTITLMIDVNDGTFQEDYFFYEFVNGEPTSIVVDPGQFLDSDYSAEGYSRDYILSQLENRSSTSAFRTDKPVSNAGWNHFSVPRGVFARVGGTTGKWWDTVKAVRIGVLGKAGGAGAAVRFDDIKILGGTERAYNGRYKAIVVAVRNDGVYQALSGPSPASLEIEVKGQGIRATVDTAVIALLDSQVNELWLYLFGGRLNAYYRVAKLTGGPFSGTKTIDGIGSDRSALITNLRLETDNAVPPDSIIGIEGPHYDRMMVLTATSLYPSRQLNPDSFSAGQVVKIGDAAEQALWIKRNNEQLYVGTTRDIYRIDGDWTIRPDGTVNISKRPLGVMSPPINSAIAIGTIGEADVLTYCAADGWRLLGGPALASGAIDLLWRGYQRHGVEFVNITGPTARFRAAISKGVLFAITPEGTSTTSSQVIHAYHFAKRAWYRHVYTRNWRSIIRGYYGELIAGDDTGFTCLLDLATSQDEGVNIPVTLWTGADDNGFPFQDKDGQDGLMRLSTAQATATINYHINGSDLADQTTTTAQTTSEVMTYNLASIRTFKQIQHRITGSFSSFVLRDFQVKYLDSPPPLVLHDTGFVDVSKKDIAWVRRIRVKAKTPGTLTVQPYWDGTAATPRTVLIGGQVNKVGVFEVPLGKEDKGKTARTVITSTLPSQVYWIEYELSGSGKEEEKQFVRVPA